MMRQFTLTAIAQIHNDLTSKFGIPRQSGIVSSLQSIIVFEPAYRHLQAFKGLEGFSHIWLLWGFSAAHREKWQLSVRPPCLGGNKRMGVFATRSPFRPNGIGLSSVKLERIEQHPKHGCILCVSGADLMDGSPIFDVKPYLAYTDSHPEATDGFAQSNAKHGLQVEIPQKWQALVPVSKLDTLIEILSHDPRPSYQEDPNRLYGMAFAGMDIKFTVQNGVLTVHRIEG